MQNKTLRLRHSRERRAGFVVIEMGTATAIIAVLIGVLFPHLQTVREKTNRARAEANMKRLCATALNSGQRPINLGSIWMAAGFPASPARSIDGYTMFLPNGTPTRIVAEPLAGRTGAETVSADVTTGCPLTISPTPGASNQLSLILENTMISGYSVVSRVTDGSSNTIMVGFANQPIQPVLSLLAGPDGGFSFSALQQAVDTLERDSSDPNLGLALKAFVQQSYAILQLGVNGEQWATLPSIAIPTSAVTVKDLLSLDTLKTLTAHCADRTDILPELLALIQASPANPGALDTYIAKVRAESNPAFPGGAAFTGQEAQALAAMAHLLR